MKLSWFDTSEAHKQYQAYIRYEYDAMQGIRERERELKMVDQTQTQRYVLRFEHPALRSRLHTEGFPLYRPHRTSHTGSLH